MSEIIRIADKKDIPFLKELYRVCFPGDEEFSRFFFKEIADPGNVLLCETDGVPSGAVHMLPVTLERGADSIPGTYIFAAGVLPSFRSRGIMKRLLFRSFDLGSARGEEFSALMTQEKSLLAYYARIGYTPFEALTESVAPGPFETVKLVREHIPEIADIYEKSTSEVFRIKRDPAFWERHMRCYTVYGAFRGERLSAYLFGEKDGDVFTVKECFGEDAPALCAGAAFAEDAKSCTVYKTPDHCIKWFGRKRAGEIYFNLYFN